MNRAMRRIANKFGITAEQAQMLWIKAQAYVAAAGSNPFNAFNLARQNERGSLSIQSIIMIFIAIVILYQLIPQISSSNTTVQNATNVSAMAKFSAGLGEWMFPLLGIIAVVFLLFRGKDRNSI
jgi:hypothetical protein